MANTSVTYHYEFGVALDEAGFNLVSAGLWTSRPELFSYTTDIVVKPADPGPPPSAAHVLTVYAVADKPFSISLYPIASLPSLPPDSFLLQGDISFSLTDSILGTITKIGITFQSTASVNLVSGNAKVSVLSFALTDIRGEQPKLTLAVAPEFAGAVPPDDGALARTFVKIVEYLSELYLNVALEKAVVQFPVPRLDQLAGFGTLGPLPIDAVYIRNKAFYIDVGDDLGNPTAFPVAPAKAVDLRLGISTRGMSAIIGAFLPIPVPLELGNNGTTLHLTSNNLAIPEIDFKLVPGAAKIPVAVHLSGTMNLHVQVPIPVLGGTFAFDVPIPIDPLTQYAGSVLATLEIDDPAVTPNAQIAVRLAPDVRFFDDWVALVVTDYRDYLANAFRQAAQNATNQLIGNTFCQIPILGWIVCGTINVVAQVVGYLVGAVLDWWISTFLTFIINTIGRLVIQFFQAPNFKILHFDQAAIQKLLGTTIAEGLIEIVDNGRDADLQADLWFQSQGLPVPLPPQPVNPLPAPQPEPVPPFPAAPVLPVYDNGAFTPAVALPVPIWSNVQQTFNITVQSGSLNISAKGVVTFNHTANQWQLHHTITDATGTKLTDAFATYDDMAFAPLRSNYASPTGTTTVRQAVDYTVSPGNATASLGLDGQPSYQYSVALLNGVAVDFDEFWIYRWAHGALSAGLAGKFGRIGLVSPTAAQNWAREIPVTLSIVGGTLSWAPAGSVAVPTPVWVITASDEQNQIVAQVAKDGTGLLKMVVNAGASTSTSVRQ